MRVFRELPQPTPLWSRIEANRLRLLARVLTYITTVNLTAGSLVAVGAWLLLASLGIPGTERVHYVVGIYTLVSIASLALVSIVLLEDPSSIAWDLGAVEAPSDALPSIRRALETARLITGVASVPRLYVMPNTSVNAFIASAPQRRPLIGVTNGLIAALNERDLEAVFVIMLTRVATEDSHLVTALSRMRKPSLLIREMTSGVIHPFWLAVHMVTWTATAGYERTCALSAERADAEALLRYKDPRRMSRAVLNLLNEERSITGLAAERWPGLFFTWPLEETPMLLQSWKRRLTRLAQVAGSEWLAL